MNIDPVSAITCAYTIADILSLPSQNRKSDGDIVNEDRSYTAVAKQAIRVILSGQFDLIDWNADIYRTATSGYDAFWNAESKPGYWPTRPQLWLFHHTSPNADIPIGMVPPFAPGEYAAAAVYVYPSQRWKFDAMWDACGYIWFFFPRSITAADLVQDHKKYLSQVGIEWRAGTPFNTLTTESDAVIIAASEFLKLPFVSTPEVAPNHKTRKDFKRQKIEPPPVRTILLRKSESKSVSSDGESHREYSCHFPVSSHWRKPNARMKEQRPVYVRPYVKGDTSKPFRSRRTVYIAAR